MHVYRVAKEDGSEGYAIPRGPYRPEEMENKSEFWRALCDDPTQWDHPTPVQEGLPFDESMYCCCASKAKLREWFHGEMAALDHEGYQIYEYEIPSEDVFNGELQSTAFFDNARLITTLPCVQHKPVK